jgi:hypothetical protein
MKIIYLLLIPILVFLGLNYRQLYSDWAIWSETRRLTDLAKNTAEPFQNPERLEDNFVDGLSQRFWKFTVIDGGGIVSNDDARHAASIAIEDGLTINHIPDTQFQYESSRSHPPAAEQYNNVTLIGGSGFQPTPSSDVVLKFSSSVSENFYGTAGVIFQPVGTLRKDGFFAKPFDMFGFSVAGPESFVQGVNGPFCYLALNWIPVKVNALPIDARAWHDYEVRLQWIDQTQWSGVVKVDDQVTCEISMPAFGPVEVHVWSDNSQVINRPRRWWEIAPSMDLKFQDGGDKQFHLKTIQIFTEAR